MHEHCTVYLNELQGQERRCTRMQRDETILAVGMAEAARRLGLSPRTVATLVSRRQLASRKVGRRRIIPVVALEAFIRNDQLPGCVGARGVTQRSARGKG